LEKKISFRRWKIQSCSKPTKNGEKCPPSGEFESGVYFRFWSRNPLTIPNGRFEKFWNILKNRVFASSFLKSHQNQKQTPDSNSTCQSGHFLPFWVNFEQLIHSYSLLSVIYDMRNLWYCHQHQNPSDVQNSSHVLINFRWFCKPKTKTSSNKFRIWWLGPCSGFVSWFPCDPKVRPISQQLLYFVFLDLFGNANGGKSKSAGFSVNFRCFFVSFWDFAWIFAVFCSFFACFQFSHVLSFGFVYFSWYWCTGLWLCEFHIFHDYFGLCALIKWCNALFQDLKLSLVETPRKRLWFHRMWLTFWHSFPAKFTVRFTVFFRWKFIADLKPVIFDSRYECCLHIFCSRFWMSILLPNFLVAIWRFKGIVSVFNSLDYRVAAVIPS